MASVGIGIGLEAAVVGAVLSRPERIFELPPGFSPALLSGRLGRRAFEAVERLLRREGKPDGIDLALIAAEAQLSDADSQALATMTFQHAEPDVARNAAALMDLRRREGLRGHLQAALQALGTDATTDAVAGDLSTKLIGLDASERPDAHEYRQAGMELVDLMEAESTGKSKALVTGFPDLDAKVRLMPGNLVILAARAGVGKSTVALNIASHVARHAGHVLFHSLEMSRVELVARDLASSGHVTLDEIISGAAVTQKADVLMREVDRRAESRLLINDAHFGLGAIQRISAKLHRRHGLKLVVVDYLQLVEANLPKANREAQVAAVSRGLKLLAASLGVPVLALSQLNRESAKRGEQPAGGRRRRDDREAGPKPTQPLPRPRLHDLRESGAIEQDANVVLALHHPWAESQVEVERTRGPYELIVLKARMGKAGIVKLIAQLEHSRFVPCVNSAVSYRGEEA